MLNPFYLSLVARLETEADGECDESFHGDVEKTNEHFRHIGLTIGLARLIKIHKALINEIQQQLKGDENKNINESGFN